MDNSLHPNRPALPIHFHFCHRGYVSARIGGTGQTNAPPDVFNYQAALKELPACEQVEIGQTTARGGITRFTLTVTFKPEALRPAPPPS